MAYSVGVDLGTTYTSAAIADEAGVRMVSLSHDGIAVPSVMAKTTDGFAVGVEALSVASATPWTVAREFKRRFGDPTPMVVANQAYSPVQLMSELLSWVINRISAMEGSSPELVSLTHPATWGNFKKELLRNVAEGAGLDRVQLLTEPEAAAIHYHERARIEEGSNIGVYDLGGGTFDATIVGRQDDAYQLRGRPMGIDHLGGLDFDAIVFRYVVSSIQQHYDSLDQEDAEALRAVARLREECVRAKIALSYDTKAVIPIILPGLVIEVLLQRREFETECKPLIDRTVIAMVDAADSAELSPKDLDAILLVGGSSRIPLIGQRLSAALGVNVALDTHPKHAIAMGAVLSALRSDTQQDSAKPIQERGTTDNTRKGAEVKGPTARKQVSIPVPTSPTVSLSVSTVEAQQLPDLTVSFDPATAKALLARRFAVILNGPRAGTSTDLPEGVTTFGRSQDRNVVELSNPLTSRRHLSLTRTGDQVEAQDLGSTNGSMIDGQLLSSEPLRAELGSILDLSGTLILIDGPAFNPGSVAALAGSWVLPEPPPQSLGSRILRRDRSQEWINECMDHIGLLDSLTPQLERARRFEQPSSGLLKFWSDRFPERVLAKRSEDPAFGCVVVGYQDQPTLFDLTVPPSAPKSAASKIGKQLEPHSVHCLTPVQLPILEGVTIIASREPAGRGLLASILYQLEHHHVGLGVRTFGLGPRRPPHPSDKSITIINSNGLTAADATEVDRAVQVSSGVVWLVPDLNQDSYWDRRILIDASGALLSETPQGQALTFVPSTMGNEST